MMKGNVFIRLIIVLMGSLLADPLRAQGGASAQLDFEFTVIATDRLKDVGYVQLKPEARSKVRPEMADFEIVPMRVNSQGRSDIYRFQGPGPVRFMKLQGPKNAPTVERVLASWNGPTWRGRSLVTLLPNAEEGLRVFAFNDDQSVHGPRQVRFLNLSGATIAGVMSGNQYALDASVQVTAARPVSGNVKVGVSFERFGKPIVAFDQSVIVSENERVLLVFLPPFRAGADVRTRVVRELLRGELGNE